MRKVPSVQFAMSQFDFTLNENPTDSLLILNIARIQEIADWRLVTEVINRSASASLP
jgi:chemotaxis signal transduction protein